MLSRFGTVTLPFIGTATTARWSTHRGYGVEMDRQRGDATVWFGRWEVNADVVKPGRMIAFALPLLACIALVASRPPRRAGVRA